MSPSDLGDGQKDIVAHKATGNTNIPALASVGIDIGKEVFHVVGYGSDGKIAFRWKLKRLAFADAFRKLPPCIVGMEACLSAHFVSRTFHRTHATV
jgi:transposase